MPAPLTASERSLRGKIAANTGWARTENRTARSQPGRDAAEDKLRERLLASIPNAKDLTPAELEKRLKNARAAHFQQLAFRSARARRRHRGGDIA